MNPNYSLYDEMRDTAIIFLYFAVGNFVTSYFQTAFWYIVYCRAAVVCSVVVAQLKM